MPLPLPTSRTEIADIQKDRKKIAVERALKTPFHQDRLAGIDLNKLEDPEEWTKIPIMDKDQLRAIPPRDFYTQFCYAPKEDIAEFWRSGGVTGIPLFYPKTFEDTKYGLLSFSRVFQCIEATSADTVHVSFPLGIHPIGQAMARAAQNVNIGTTWAGAGNSTPSEAQINLIQLLQPTIWMGMSSYGLHLANLAEGQGVDLASGSVHTLVCSAEQLTDAKRAKIGRMWGAKVYDVFGMTEAGLMGCESTAHDGFHIWTDMYFIEVVDAETFQPVAEGEQGLLLVTPLWTNNAAPFLRWNSGDVVTYKEHGASDTPFSVFPVVKHAHRTVGFFKIRGVNVNHTEFEDFMFGIPEVADFKAELVTKNHLEQLKLYIELSRSAEGDAEAQIQTATKNTFEITPDITVLERGTIAAEFESSVKAPRFRDLRQ